MRTKTGAVARELCNAIGSRSLIFNDRLTDGRRSLKVWGWTVQNYFTAKAMLEAAGCNVEMRTFKSHSFYSRGKKLQTRLYVTE